jgi:hypothetical protein
LLGGMADALFRALGGSGGPAAPTSGVDVPLPAAPPPGAPAGSAHSLAHPLASSGSVTDAIPQFLAVLCAFSFALLQGGKFCLGREPGRLRSNALSLAVERPG